LVTLGMISSFMSNVTLLRVESVDARPGDRPPRRAGCSGVLDGVAVCECDSLDLRIAGLGIARATNAIN
jgi:hypothetical protein